jgi:hypothetical protein
MDSADSFASETLSTPGRAPPSETVERMLQSASYGAQMLESALQQANVVVATPGAPPEVRSSRDPEENDKEGTNGPASAPKRQVRNSLSTRYVSGTYADS